MLLANSVQSEATAVEEFVRKVELTADETDSTILKEFVAGLQGEKTVEELREEYIVFKKDWVNKMVEFLIRELMINEESAKEARKNPESFYINFDTYKLFTGSHWVTDIASIYCLYLLE